MKFGNCLLLKTKKKTTLVLKTLHTNISTMNPHFFFCVYLKLINTYQSFNTKNTCKACFDEKKEKERPLFF